MFMSVDRYFSIGILVFTNFGAKLLLFFDICKDFMQKVKFIYSFYRKDLLFISIVYCSISYPLCPFRRNAIPTSHLRSFPEISFWVNFA